MTSVITFSLLKGLLAGIATGYVSQRVRSMLLGILAGIGIAAALSLLVILRAGMTLFWDILPPGMLLGAIVGFATQRFGRTGGSALAVRWAYSFDGLISIEETNKFRRGSSMKKLG